MDEIKPGMTGTAKMVVGTNDTAPRVGSGKIEVLATPVMINLIEEAALDAIEAALPEGMQSLGTHLGISHIAATPTGMTVVAAARVTRVDGRTITFEVQVADEKETIGSGTHTRVVVTAAKFQARVDEKAGD
ncbi:MAG: thioesterase family protein [Silicimonas sp.]|nr:thioesterase family protein [Silicimonas sp.]